MIEQVEFGAKIIPFTIHFANRKTLGLQVHPDSSVHAVAPLDANINDIVKKVQLKAAWILKQQQYFASFRPLTPQRKYVNGETHKYLGRQYRLKKIVAELENVKLYRGYIEVHAPAIDATSIENILAKWMHTRAKEVFKEIFADVLMKEPRLRKICVTLYVKSMNTRWGSCSPNGRITLNTELIKSPKACIEYVIIHELCHTIYPNHSKKFYRLLSTIMPDWEQWKERLERSMA